jgi:hypothetical protein
MRTIFGLALLTIMGALLLSGTTRTASSCSDYDQDGVCPPTDCNDFNPTINYDGDYDGDGVTVCQGDCMDDDPTVLKCGEIHREYPVIYSPPEQPCRQGYTVTTSLHNCWYGDFGQLYCDTTPFYEYDTNYLRDCYPYG